MAGPEASSKEENMQFFVYGSPADMQPGPEALAEMGSPALPSSR
jgi:hypothetical protein